MIESLRNQIALLCDETTAVETSACSVHLHKDVVICLDVYTPQIVSPDACKRKRRVQQTHSKPRVAITSKSGPLLAMGRPRVPPRRANRVAGCMACHMAGRIASCIACYTAGHTARSTRPPGRPRGRPPGRPRDMAGRMASRTRKCCPRIRPGACRRCGRPRTPVGHGSDNDVLGDHGRACPIHKEKVSSSSDERPRSTSKADPSGRART